MTNPGSITFSRGRVAILLATGLIAALVIPAASARQPGERVVSGHPTRQVLHHPRWPRDLCSRQRGHRITTTSTLMNYVAEPARGRPRITAKRALANFVHIYGRLRPRDRRTTQVRYGIITTADSLVLSNNALIEEPMVRRTRGWMITNCKARTRAHDVERHPGHPGVLVFALADQRAPLALDWGYQYFDYHGAGYSTWGSGIVGGPEAAMPPMSSTRYYSVPWRLVKRRDHGRQLLLRYRQRRCYSLDHINVGEDVYPKHGAFINVILSTGPHGRCARPSAIAPYMGVVAYYGRFGPLHHGPTGPLTFQPISSQGGSGVRGRSEAGKS